MQTQNKKINTHKEKAIQAENNFNFSTLNFSEKINFLKERANLSEKLNRDQRALQDYLDILKLLKTESPMSPKTIPIHKKCSDIYSKLGKHQKTINHLLCIAKIQENRATIPSKDSAKTYFQIAQFFLSIIRKKKALFYLNKTLEILENHTKDSHPEIQFIQKKILEINSD